MSATIRLRKGLTPKSRFRPRSKYGAQPTVVDGIRFASKKEARRYGELKLLEKAGAIRKLVVQPRFELAVFTLDPSDARVIGTYVGDFQYETVSGKLVVEDVKGFKTALYKWKKRHVEAQCQIEIREV